MEFQRPKRVIKRPKKYLTTPSEDEPLPKRWIPVTVEVDEEVDEVVDEEVDHLEGSLLDMEGEEPESPPPTPHPRSQAPVQPCSPPSSPLPTEELIMQMWECMQQSAERENRYIENQERLLRKQEQLQESVARLDEKLEGLRRIATAAEQWERPNNLPLRSIEDVGRFESCPADEYDSVVGYLAQVGGHSLRQMVNASFKEVFTDNVAASYTWSGAHGTRPLYRTRIIYAIYAAAKRSREFTTTKRDFGKTARLALKAAKQRIRQRPVRVVPPIPAKRIRKTEIITRTIGARVQGSPLKYEY
ncbi:uncharacterized protein LOC143209996 isoform X2 [Lasioglossum baleicum]|uniref:uncharacterized protein LOC143209996 isoform X2 n=1 Tax=Lasioglossum baleicum TaxID=434251 RepID=UPI003FCD8956